MIIFCTECFTIMEVVPESHRCPACGSKGFSMGELEIIENKPDDPEQKEEGKETFNPFIKDYKAVCVCGEEYMEFHGFIDGDDNGDKFTGAVMECSCGRKVKNIQFEADELVPIERDEAVPIERNEEDGMQ